MVTIALTAFLVFADADALAQVRNVEPYYVVATGDHVYVRSGAGTVWYAVGRVNAGDVLRVDGEEYKWLRVEYPQGAAALVSVENADYISDRGAVVITRPSALKAFNIQGKRLAASWKNLMAKPLAPGAELNYIDSFVGPSGQVEGYLVEPPPSARGFISEQFTRRATQREIDAYRAAQRSFADEASAKMRTAATITKQPTKSALPASPATPEPVDDASRTANSSANPITPSSEKVAASGSSATSEPHEKTPAVSIGESAPPSIASQSPERRRGAEATQTNPSPQPSPEGRGGRSTLGRASGGPGVSPVAAHHGTTAEPAAPLSDATSPTQPDHPGLRFKKLESAFRALAREPVESAEIQPLLAEYQRFADSLDDTEESRRLSAPISNRISLLEVRLQLQENLRALDRASAAAGADARAINARLGQLARSRPYSLVGRLAVSAIYDGKKLPLMYRLQSVEAGSARTLAYLVPTSKIDLKGKLGSIVGVDGDSRIDPALKLRIVHPTRVDALRPRLASVDEQPDQP